MKPDKSFLTALEMKDSRGFLSYSCSLMTEEDCKVISEDEIAALQDKYGLLGDYLPAVLQARRELEKDPARLMWAAVASYAFSIFRPSEATKIPMPVSDGSLAADMVPLFPLLARAEWAAQSYRDHGFSEEEVKTYLKSYAGCIATVDRRNGQPGINKSYFHWLALYATAVIFRIGGLNFNFREFADYAVILRHNETGKREILLRNKVFNAAGMPIESELQNIPEGAYSTAFAETADAFYGHPVRNYRCTKELTAYPKTDWSIYIQQGDPVLGVHIPRGADISEPAARAALTAAQNLVKERFPEKPIKGLTCNSWLLDPAFETMLKDGSKIRQFANIFERFPNKSAGGAVYSFVFDKKMPPEEWPEDTSLERALKQYYLSGHCVYFTNGFYPLDEER